MQNKKKIAFPVIVEIDEDNVLIVSCPMFKGCHSYGKTIDEALRNLTEVIELCIEESNETIDTTNQYLGMREINIELTNKNQPAYA